MQRHPECPAEQTRLLEGPSLVGVAERMYGYSVPRASIEYRIGAASWTDPTLLAAGYYPPECKTAEQRLRFYAAQFDTVEVDSTYYALPSERNAALWSARTPPGFRFNVKAFAWLTLHAAETRALPRSIREQLTPEQLAEPRLAAPSEELRELAFAMFLAALEPLRRAHKLGCLLFQYPPWFTASARNEEELATLHRRCGADPVAVEFRHASWFGKQLDRTLEFLRAHGLIFVSIDTPRGPSIPPPVCTATAEIAYVRFHGRNRQTWFRRTGTAAERFQYFYSEEELRQWADRMQRLEGVRVCYAIFNNCYADYGVRNAATLKALLCPGSSPGPSTQPGPKSAAGFRAQP